MEEEPIKHICDKLKEINKNKEGWLEEIFYSNVIPTHIIHVPTTKTKIIKTINYCPYCSKKLE